VVPLFWTGASAVGQGLEAAGHRSREVMHTEEMRFPTREQINASS
jgi:hypothetical protein